MSTLPPTQRPTNRTTPPAAAERFCPNGLAGDVPRDGTQLLHTLRWRLVVLGLCLLANACAAQGEPQQTADGATCGIDLDARVDISVDDAHVFAGRAADFRPMPCAAPVRTCSPWRATALCEAADGFTRQTWTLNGNDGSVTLETETRGAASTTEQLTIATATVAQ